MGEKTWMKLLSLVAQVSTPKVKPLPPLPPQKPTTHTKSTLKNSHSDGHRSSEAQNRLENLIGGTTHVYTQVCGTP